MFAVSLPASPLASSLQTEPSFKNYYHSTFWLSLFFSGLPPYSDKSQPPSSSDLISDTSLTLCPMTLPHGAEATLAFPFYSRILSSGP